MMSPVEKLKAFVVMLKIIIIYYITLTASIGNDIINKEKLKPIIYTKKNNYVAVVTGGGRGIGAHVVKGLLKCEMTVVIGVRNSENCKELINDISALNLPGKLHLMKLDLSSMKSVRQFANNIIQKYDHVNILVNNAGIIFGGYEETEDGFESKIATNYLGHFLLSHLLLPVMEETGVNCGFKSRIVNVSSSGHTVTNMNLDDIHMKKYYVRLGAYGQSKLAQLMFSRYLNKTLSSFNSHVMSVAVHPGVVASSMSLDWQETIIPVKRLIRSEEEGARNILCCCLNPGFIGGEYFYNDGEGFSTKESRNEQKQESLFRLSCDLIGIDNFYGNRFNTVNNFSVIDVNV